MAADALQVGSEIGHGREAILLKAERLREWYPTPQSRNRLIEVLKQRSMLLPGRDPSTSTIQKQIAGLGKHRKPYYAFDPEGLSSGTSARASDRRRWPLTD